MSKKSVLLYLIIILVIITISIALTTAFFSKSSITKGNITLKELDFSIYGDSDDNIIVMPGDSTKIDCYVINSRDVDGNDYDNLTSIYVKFNLVIKSENKLLNYEITEENNDFIKIDDTYYYTKEIAPGEIVKIIKDINFDSNIDNSFNGKPIDFDLTVDAIQSTKDAIKELWPNFYDYLVAND